jgi:hypothetical protein
MKSPLPQLKERRSFVSWWNAVRHDPRPTGAYSVQLAVPVLSILINKKTELARAVDRIFGNMSLQAKSTAQQMPACT